MSTYEAVFIRCNAQPTEPELVALGELIQSVWPGVQTIARYMNGKPWLQLQNLDWIESVDEQESSEIAAHISKAYDTEVICLYGESVVDAYIYLRYRSGTLVVSLCYGLREQYTWDRAIWTRDDIECQVLLNHDELARFCDGVSNEDAERYRQIYESGKIPRDSDYPSLSNFDFHDLGKQLQLPGFSNAHSVHDDTWDLEYLLKQSGS